MKYRFTPFSTPWPGALGGFGVTDVPSGDMELSGYLVNLPKIWNEEQRCNENCWRHRSHFCKELFLNILKMLNICEATGEFGIPNKYYLGVCPLCVSPLPGLMWPERYATRSSIFHPSAIIQAVPFSDSAGPFYLPSINVIFFSQVDFKHSSSLFFI